MINCFDSNDSIYDWTVCMEDQVHAANHGMMGGAFNCNVSGCGVVCLLAALSFGSPRTLRRRACGPVSCCTLGFDGDSDEQRLRNSRRTETTAHS